MSEFYPSSDEADDAGEYSMHGRICIFINDTFMRTDLIRDFLKDRFITTFIFNKNTPNMHLIQSLSYKLNKPSIYLPFNYNDINSCVDIICKNANEFYIFHDGHSNADQLEVIGNAVGNEGMPVFMIQCPMMDPRKCIY